MRAYSQTRGMWLHGILRESFGLRPDAMRWATFEDAHLAEHRAPSWAGRAPAGADMLAMLRAGELDAAVFGNEPPADAALRPAFPDPEAAGAAFRAAHGFVPVNHLLVARGDVAREKPEALAELLRVLRTAGAEVPGREALALRALATTTCERSPLAPEVPTFQELGFPGFEVVEHVAMLAPAGTPAPVLQRLNAACAAALRVPDMQPKLQAMAVTPEAQPLEAWPAYFRAESDKWRGFVRARNIRVQ